MKAVIQRVKHASVTVNNEVVGKIDRGLLVLFCAERDDTEENAAFYARKIAKLRIFADDEGKTNLSVADVDGAVLAVSQFTLAADWRKGNRPGFSRAESPDRAQALYEKFCDDLRREGIKVETGRFAAEMNVDLLNDGPFTIVMDSRD